MDPVYPNSEILPTGTKRVVEVVDCLADTVVTVTHVEEAQGTNYRKACLVGLLAFFVIAGATFFSALSTTSSNKEAMREHLAAGKVLHEFRPERVSNGLGWVGAGSLALGLASRSRFLSVVGKKKVAL
ncbi:MAG: hypothetical protein JKY56_17415 [Kofleriaceae bacterium]|nr:hypothetical protein [Kofleriaceae bacterium]